MKTKFEMFKDMIDNFFSEKGIKLECLSSLHETSKNDSGSGKPAVYVYNQVKDIEVIDMDIIAKMSYKPIINNDQNPINTADAFIINSENEWFFIEFKDSKIEADNKSLKDNIIKKAYSNWYMILDIIYKMKNTQFCFNDFDFDDPIKFGRSHVNYILVCSIDKNAHVYLQIKNHELLNEKYTPPFMYRLKDYLFKDAYVYTPDYLAQKIVNNFKY